MLYLTKLQNILWKKKDGKIFIIFYSKWHLVFEKMLQDNNTTIKIPDYVCMLLQS